MAGASSKLSAPSCKERAQKKATSSKLQAARESKPFFATDQHGLREERGQLTSRSSVLKGARSRVVIGENTNGGGGLQSNQHSAKDAVWVTLSRRAMDLFPHALDARVGHPGKSSSKLSAPSYKEKHSFRHGSTWIDAQVSGALW